MKATQEQRILEMLRQGQWVCGTRFLAEFMPRYSSVIHTLRHQRGYGIAGRACEQHAHGGQVYEFRITRWPETSVPAAQTSWL